jgi:hypothetical protein
VFAPVENENVYTNDWQGPFDGYRHAIETYELNDVERRLGILTIYYHFYSAAKTASFRALLEVYDWAIKQETTPLYLSQYAAKVVAFQRATLARRIDSGSWELGNLGELRTVRLDPALGFPDVARSPSLAGVRDAHQGRYVHLTDDLDRGIAVLPVTPTPSSGPLLVHANGRALRWRHKGERRADIRVVGNLSLELEVEAIGPCILHQGHTSVRGTSKAGRGRLVTTSFRLQATDTGEAELECQL